MLTKMEHLALVWDLRRLDPVRIKLGLAMALALVFALDIAELVLTLG